MARMSSIRYLGSLPPATFTSACHANRGGHACLLRASLPCHASRFYRDVGNASSSPTWMEAEDGGLGTILLAGLTCAWV